MKYQIYLRVSEERARIYLYQTSMIPIWNLILLFELLEFLEQFPLFCHIVTQKNDKIELFVCVFDKNAYLCIKVFGYDK